MKPQPLFNHQDVRLDPDDPTLSPEEAAAIRELHAYLEANPPFQNYDPAADDCDDTPRGYRGRPIAVVRGIHPRNFLIAAAAYISVLALIAFISLIIRIFNP